MGTSMDVVRPGKVDGRPVKISNDIVCPLGASETEKGNTRKLDVRNRGPNFQ